MLGKLLKHEWKSTYKTGCLMLVVLVGITFLGWLAFRSPMWQTLYDDNAYYRENFGFSVLNLVSVFTLLFYLVMLVAVPIGILAYLGVRFYKTMYTDEGYLTHTLPVKEGQLMIVKTLISSLWVLIIFLGVCLSVFALMMFLISATLPPGYTLDEFWEEFEQVYGMGMRDVVNMFESELGISFRAYFIYIIISMILGAFTSIMTLFGAISMGQLFTKHRVLMAIVSYILVKIVMGILGSVVKGFVTYSYVSNHNDSPTLMGSYLNTNSIITLVLNLIFAVLLYWVSYLVNTKKLNLE